MLCSCCMESDTLPFMRFSNTAVRVLLQYARARLRTHGAHESTHAPRVMKAWPEARRVQGNSASPCSRRAWLRKYVATNDPCTCERN